MDNQTKKPHVHAGCIKAWAEGIQIEFRTDLRDGWRELRTPHPHWQEDFEYRIKPEPKPDVIEYRNYYPGNNLGGRHCSIEDAKNAVGAEERSLGVIKFIFYGETGKLKKAEVIG